MIDDRTMIVQPHQTVVTQWVDIDLCKLGSRARMTPEAVEKKWRGMLQIGDGQQWPPVVGHWDCERFVVDDGRHCYLAALMHGRTRLLVCWLSSDQR